MNEKDFNEFAADIANQCAVTYSKTAWRDEDDFEKLKRIIHAELKLGFGHLLIISK